MVVPSLLSAWGHHTTRITFVRQGKANRTDKYYGSTSSSKYVYSLCPVSDVYLPGRHWPSRRKLGPLCARGEGVGCLRSTSGVVAETGVLSSGHGDPHRRHLLRGKHGVAGRTGRGRGRAPEGLCTSVERAVCIEDTTRFEVVSSRTKRFLLVFRFTPAVATHPRNITEHALLCPTSETLAGKGAPFLPPSYC